MACCTKCEETGGTCGGNVSAISRGRVTTFPIRPGFNPGRYPPPIFLRPPPAPAAPSMLFVGQQLNQNQYISSPSGRYRLYMQNDGNLVLYEVFKGNLYPAWASNTAGSGAVRAVMQSDGNFVLYTANNRAVWATNTAGIPYAAQYARLTMLENATFTVGTPLDPNAFVSVINLAGPGKPRCANCARPRGSLAAPTIQAVNNPPATTSTGTYVAVGAAALAVGALGAIWYERNKHS